MSDMFRMINLFVRHKDLLAALPYHSSKTVDNSNQKPADAGFWSTNWKSNVASDVDERPIKLVLVKLQAVRVLTV